MRISDWSSDVCSSDLVLALANTRDSSGNYIFSGAQVGAPAFARDASGAILWRGSGEPPRVPVNADVTVSMGASGLSMLSIDTSSGRQTIFQSLMAFKDRKSTRLNSSH